MGGEMKKALLTVGIILVALSIMAPATDKAERLKVDDQDWDREGAQFVVSMSCKFGIANAGEHANFTTRTKLTIVAGGKTYTEEGTGGIAKVAGATKDADGYIAIEPTKIAWDRQGFTGDAGVTTSLTLVGPNGNTMGDAVVTITTVRIEEPPSVKVDNNDWDYDPKNNAIVVPLLANSNIVDKGYKVTVDVDVWNTDEKKTFAGSGRGSTDIVKVDDNEWDYVQIQPVLAVLKGTMGWNGDDDGTGIVSGTIELVDPLGNVISITTFENQTVGFVIHEKPPES